MDPVVYLDDEMKKTQVNKEIEARVLNYVEKAHNISWREGLRIKLHTMGVGGRIFNWIMDFLKGRLIQVW